MKRRKEERTRLWNKACLYLSKQSNSSHIHALQKPHTNGETHMKSESERG
jgi:hypothetical protein